MTLAHDRCLYRNLADADETAVNANQRPLDLIGKVPGGFRHLLVSVLALTSFLQRDPVAPSRKCKMFAFVRVLLVAQFAPGGPRRNQGTAAAGGSRGPVNQTSR